MSNPSTRGSASRGRAAPARLATLMAAVLGAALLPVLGTTGSVSAAPGHSKGPWAKIDGQLAPTSKAGRKADIRAKRLAAFSLDRTGLQSQLDRAPQDQARGAKAASVVVSLPGPSGELQRFELVESPVMEAGLAAKHPEIKTYAGKGLDDPTASIRADLTPLGFHASVRSTQGAWYVDPYYNRDQSVYASYYAADLTNQHGTFVEREDVEEAADALKEEVEAAQADNSAAETVKLRTYRLALVTDPSYANYFGAENVTAAKVTLINRVTQIYEDETAIRLVLVNDTDKTNLNTPALATEPNGPCGAAACFTPAQVSSCASSTLSRNRIVLGQIIGASNYDVGHIAFGLSGGGVASLGVIGGNNKAQGCTGLPNPIGDYFAVDYVAHEIGHQFAGNHTFNGTQHNCSSGNRSAANSYEPGSGSTIMGYAGICRQDNLQPHTDPYWSHRTYYEFTTYVTSNRPAINEVQTVSLRAFDTDGDSFRIMFGGQLSAPIVRGVNYTTAGIKTAIESTPRWPAGATVTVAAFGGSGTLNDTGFQVTFGGTLAGVNVQQLGLTSMVGASGFVGETAKGGPIDNGGWLVEETDNYAPVVTVAPSYTIPVRTPFALTGSATDANGDTVTYLWEQNDRGGINGGSTAGTALVENNKTNGPLFRVFGTSADVSPTDTQEYHSPGENLVTTNPTRVFPDMAQILAGNTNARTGRCQDAPPPPTSGSASNLPADILDCFSEFLPTANWVGFNNDRTLHFKLTARDARPGGGGIGSADTALVLAPQAGPFLVTSQAAATTYRSGSSQEITWDVANTDVAPVNASNVKITLSTDGGETFSHVLAASAPNNGTATVTLPNIETTQARIKIEAVGNVFFAVNDADFAIQQLRAATLTYTGDTLAYTFNGGTSTNALLRATVNGGAGDVRNATVAFKAGNVTLCTADVKLLGATTADGSASCHATLPVGSHAVTAAVDGVFYTGSTSGAVAVVNWDGLSITGEGYIKGGNTTGAYPLDDDHRIEVTLDARVNNGNKLAGFVKIGYKSGDKRYKFQGSQLDSFGAGSAGGVGAADLRYTVTLFDISTPQNPVAVYTGLTMKVTATDQGGPGRKDSLAITVWDGEKLLFSSDWNGSATQEINLTASGGNLTIR